MLSTLNFLHLLSWTSRISWENPRLRHDGLHLLIIWYVQSYTGFRIQPIPNHLRFWNKQILFLYRLYARIERCSNWSKVIVRLNLWSLYAILIWPGTQILTIIWCQLALHQKRIYTSSIDRNFISRWEELRWNFDLRRPSHISLCTHELPPLRIHFVPSIF